MKKLGMNVQFVACLRDELWGQLAEAKITKIYHPMKEELLFCFSSRSGVQRLLLCCATGRARAGLVTQNMENNAHPSSLCMFFRKHLTGATLKEVRQPNEDRILEFVFRGFNQISEEVSLILCAEFTGKHPNLLLLSEDFVILEAVRKFDVTQSFRPTMPGLRYEYPPKSGYIVEKKAIDCHPWLQFSEKHIPKNFSCEKNEEESWELMGSFSQLLEKFYTERDEAERLRQRTGELLKFCENRAERASRKAEAQTKDLGKAENREYLRVFAELIFSNIGQLERTSRGESFYRLENYYDENKLVEIPVNPALSPAANGQKYYKLFQKQKHAAKILVQLIQNSQEEMNYFERVVDFLRRAKTLSEVEQLREELRQGGYIKEKKDKKKLKKQSFPPLEFRTEEGLRVLVGRNNLQNDQLTTKIARADDLWFHVQGGPGAHVLLCCEGRTPQDASVEEAARLALSHSKARGGTAPVDYALIRDVKKPAGAPPGKVFYHRCKTIVINDQKK